MNLTFRHLMSGAATALLLVAAAGAQAQTYFNSTVGGQLAPGVYGRIDIGNAPPPLIYAEPMIIQRPAVMVPRSPIYLYVPPGHAKNWGKHCARYNACGQPVYFVKEPVRGQNYGGRPGNDRRDDRRWDDGHRGAGKHDRGDRHDGRGEGRGKGHGQRD
ncbi:MULTISPECIES: hypothetical protein [unclassified Acidovorax]|uniref:hypothetical protein n=1 Tax=unclassified Acidovorax TaxID=2684926 RepID=UPI000B40436D|nr:MULTISPECIES: hypothetical protein [unclassified Acidovorax]